MLIWDPASPGTVPAELGRDEGTSEGVAVLANGRVVTGGADGRVLIWDPARAGTPRPSWAATEGTVCAVAALADGRVVTGGADGRVLIWDPARRGSPRPSWAAPKARCSRWRCWPTGGWSPAGPTGGC